MIIAFDNYGKACMEIGSIIGAVEKNWVPFFVSYAKKTKLLWINEDYCSGNASRKNDFLNEFSFINADTACFADIDIDQTCKITLLAERYGGVGVGTNGGGARCGNRGAYQIKGVGTNPLVGESIDATHSYGGLDALNAISEVIYTNVLKKILPVGVADILGLILISEKTGRDPRSGNPCWGVILVREAILRPAHFLPAAHFKPHQCYRKTFVPDAARVRNVNRALASHFESHNKFIHFLGEYLAGSANQLAFARVARVMHSTLSPSNMSIDGRWLDLPLTGFVKGGVNYGLSSNFYDEPSLALNAAIELLYNYSKYNDILLNPAPLISYYNEQFVYYCRFHIGYLIGIKLDRIPDEHILSWNMVADLFLKKITSGKHIVRSRAEPDRHDPISDLLLGLFLKNSDEMVANRYFMRANFTHEMNSELFDAFDNVLDLGFSLRKDCCKTVLQYKNCRLIIAIKRVVYSGIFYLSKVEDQVRNLCETKSTDDVCAFIEDYRQIGEWVFEGVRSNEIILFKSIEMKIYYSIELEVYYVVQEGIDAAVFENFSRLFKFIDSCNEGQFFIRGFNCKDFFIRLNDVLPTMEFQLKRR